MKRFIRLSSAAGAASFFVALALGPAQAADQVSVARGAQTWADNCDRCHEMRDPGDFGANQWRVIVTHMRIRAGLTGAEARDVLEFLQKSGASGPVSTRPTSSSATVAAAADGKQIYQGTCIACHGPDGKGAIRGVPDLTQKSGVLSQSDSVLLQRIEQGFQTPSSPMAMPPKGGNPTLTDADLKAVLRYMHTTFGQR